jgi:magnesium/cobalt transport protein CorA
VTVRARLYDARGDDRDVDIADVEPGKIDDRTLLWIDLDSHEAAHIDSVVRAVGLEPQLARALAVEQHRPRLVRLPERIAFVLFAVDHNGEETPEDLVRRELDVVVGRNLVVTVHDGPLGAIRAYEDQVRHERDLGLLDAGAFISGLVDAVLTGFVAEVEAIERAIDRLDQAALRASAEHDDFLAEIVMLRRRIAVLRRWLAPNRDALAPLTRPDLELHGDLVPTWPGLIDRLERVIGQVENARELLVGSFDIYLGRSAQRSNDVMKTLTIVSSILLPSVVLAGVMGMNFKLPFFDNAANFFVVVGAMILFASAILIVARWRHWI